MPRLDAKTLTFNYLLSISTGLMWYFQFFFYSMGQTKMGKYDFSSWTLHMASIIIFSTLWGVLLKEWKGSSRRTEILVGLGLAADSIDGRRGTGKLSQAASHAVSFGCNHPLPVYLPA